ncbi:MAG: hypothetical protein ACLUNZ_09155 [Evtepia sp.]
MDHDHTDHWPQTAAVPAEAGLQPGRRWPTARACIPPTSARWSGEKNITVETLGKITAALEIPITAVFEELPQPAAPSEENYPLKAYQILATLPEREQAKLYTILAQIRTLF